ncbi:MAG TPA: sialidase family protein, partial [Acidobacteriota bacterium]|nr:sialidase family protein [Acidobacteriota bacterium]
MRYGSRMRVLRWVLAGAFIVSLIHLSQDSNEEKYKKESSGYSFAGRTIVEAVPSPSNAAAGFESERAMSGHDDWEPAVAADLLSHYVYQFTTRFTGKPPCAGCPLPALVFRRSGSSGAAWSYERFLHPAQIEQWDPQIAVAAGGAVYACWLEGSVAQIQFMRSTNHGSSWTPPVPILHQGVAPRWGDKPTLAVSPDGRYVYIAFSSSDSYVAASQDFGHTFSHPVKTNSDQRYWFHSGSAVAADGTAYFAAADYSQNFTGDVHVDVLRSTDHGLTWTTKRLDTSRELPPCQARGCYQGFYGPAPSISIDAAGKIMMVYNAGVVAGGPEKLWFKTSLNGQAWSQRIQLSSNDSNIDNQFPVVAHGPAAGDFRVAWQHDRSGDPDDWNTVFR